MADLKKDYEEDEDFGKAFREVAGEVFQVRWYRVILDEAHEIKNTNTKGMTHLPRLVIKSLETNDKIHTSLQRLQLSNDQKHMASQRHAFD